MKDDRAKLMILGMGLVGNSLLSLLVKEQLFRTEDILVADHNSNNFAQYEAMGGLSSNRIVISINKQNYPDLLDHLNSGDLLLALATDLDYSIMLAECLKRGIHFICGAGDSFYDDSVSDQDAQPTDEENDYAEQIHYEASRRAGQLYKEACTSIMQFGCNPGLISVLTKKAFQDIVREDKGDFVSANRSELQEMLENSTLQEDPFLCNCQCTMPPGQRLRNHIEKMIDPLKIGKGISYGHSLLKKIIV